MIKSPKRVAIQITNLLISILCILSIAMYFIQPLWKIDLSYTVTGEAVEEMFKELTEDEEMEDIDVQLKDIPLHISLQFETKDVLASLSDNPTATIQKMIDTNVSMLVDKLTVELSAFVKEVVKAFSKQTVTSSVKEQVKDILGESTTTEEVEQVLQDAGITDTYIEDKTDALIDSIYAEGATVESVTEEVVNVVEETFNLIAENGNPEFADALTEETKEEIRDVVAGALSSLADENGNLNIDALIASGILDMLNNPESESDPANKHGLHHTTPAKAEANDSPYDSAQDSPYDSAQDSPYDSAQDSPYDSSLEDSSLENSSTSEDSDIDNEQTEEDLYAEVKAKLLEEIQKNLPETLVEDIANGMKIVSYVLIFTFFTWAYLILKIIFKAGKTNNAIRLKLPIWLGCIPFLVLYLIPTGFISLLNNPAMLGDILPADLFLEWESVSEGFSLTFASGSWFSFAAAIVLIVISILFYNGIYNYLSNVSESLTALHNNTYVESARTAHTEETVEDRDEDEPQPTIIKKDAYNVVLKAIGPNKIEIIKTVREATGLGLADAKNLVENMGVIKSGLSWEEAENLAEELREGGAEVELR